MSTKVSLQKGWHFTRADLPHKTSLVDLPHTVDITPANSSGCRNYQGKCSYKKAVFISEKKKGMGVILEFGGAMGISCLYINGAKVAEHDCGYTPFVVDITDFVNYGEKNQIQLELDNSDNPNAPVGKPQSALDFTYDGGLYRHAALIYMPQVHITHALVEHEVAGGGVFVWSEHISQASAEIFTKIHVRNNSATTKNIKIRAVFKHKGMIVGDSECYENFEAGQAKHSTLALNLNAPNLWSIETPNLYTVNISLSENGRVLDKTSVDFGIRSLNFTYENALIFNGISRRISGGNYHQTYPYIGNAVPASLLRRDVRKLKSVGFENIRSHYPFADDFMDECNKAGMTVLVANPGWQWFSEGIFAERLIENMRQIVRWQRNNPSVILWEPMPNESVVPQEFQQILHDVVHEEYPHPYCFTASDHGPTDVSYRMYDPGMLEPGMEGYNPIKRYGTKSDYPVWIREYNDAPDNWVDQNCAWRTPRGWGDGPMLRAVQRMCGLDSQCKTNNYSNMYNNKMICGYGMWPAMEHNRGYHINPCWGGLWDMFRVPKFTKFFFESQQDIAKDGCVIYIANWWTDISPEDVTVFSNAQKVRLYHDDVLVGEEEPQDIAVKHPPFMFKDVHNRFKTRDRSTLRAEAIVDGKVIAETIVKTPGVPNRLELWADLENIEISRGDIVAIQCRVLDADGSIVPYSADNHPIIFTVEGGKVIGDAKNGANPICPEAGIAVILVKILDEQVTIHADLYWKQNNPRAAIKPAVLVL